jgi:hypothetical protein
MIEGSKIDPPDYFHDVKTGNFFYVFLMWLFIINREIESNRQNL